MDKIPAIIENSFHRTSAKIFLPKEYLDPDWDPYIEISYLEYSKDPTDRTREEDNLLRAWHRATKKVCGIEACKCGGFNRVRRI